MLTYRKATPRDSDELIRMRLEFLGEMHGNELGVDGHRLMPSLRAYFDAALRDDSFLAWLALDGDRIVATSGLCFYTVPPSYKNTTGRVAYIMNMYTKRAYRGRGIASQLFEKTLAEAKLRGYKKISLHATEMGRPLYQKFGFMDAGDEMVLFI